MADTDQNETDVGRSLTDLRHVDDTLAFIDSRQPRQIEASTPLVWMNDANQRTTVPGQYFVTRDHDVIRTWAEGLHGKPAMLKSRAGGDVAEALRFQVTDKRRSEYDVVTWDEWFRAFDGADLVFIFQERADDGAVSDLFRIAPAATIRSIPR
jgi:hypothetical protein